MSRSAIVAMLLLLAGMLTLPVVGHAQDGINRCVNAAGATDRPSPGNNLVSSGHRIVVARTCARKPEELLFDVRNALAAQDVNRLAGAYLWTGMGSREAYSLMDRLSAFSARPLVDAQLVSSPSTSDSPPAVDADAASPAENIPAATPPAPDLIRVEQTSSASDAATATSYLRIVPAAGCLWVSF
jgi:hypothetical protein